tara:strand:- start:5450 stop:5818 length:369 start_codon:yes stop_codon:yes gene_type:complete
MTGRPFALIGVNSDKDLDKINAIIKQKNLNWRSFQNSPEGAKSKISTDWAVKGWPTLVVIDENMKIQYRGHNGHEASALATKLTRELELKLEKQNAEKKGGADRKGAEKEDAEKKRDDQKRS